MEKAIRDFPSAQVLHIYGGSEAEPVALIEAQEALTRSQQKNYFQVLCLGKPIEDIKIKFKETILWVSGPNVAQEYLGEQRENLGVKERDESGILWHNMGDRIFLEKDFLWLQGRANQDQLDFALEQKIYSHLQSSKSFLHRSGDNKLILVGEDIHTRSDELKSRFPQIDIFLETKIIRDRRHRSRIDRVESLPKQLRTKHMNYFSRWMTYLQERSPLPALLFISATGSLSSLAFRQNFDLGLFLVGIFFNTLIFIQLRLGDEVKDFEKDKVVNPLRPLPRGLLSPQEVLRAMNLLSGIILLGSGGLSYFYHPLGALILALATLFGQLMYHEFFMGAALNKSPLLYALTHQIIVFFIYGWVALSASASVIEQKVFLGWLLANFGASFTFEICRKLNPKTHPMAHTYAQHYGPWKTYLLCLVFIFLMAMGSFITGIGWWVAPLLILLALGLYRWIKDPTSFKKIEALSALAGIIIAAGPAIMWLIESRK
jgi:4-hydroxybenzoate polyprenyltransferase